jgi:hypothetical protein
MMRNFFKRIYQWNCGLYSIIRASKWVKSPNDNDFSESGQ